MRFTISSAHYIDDFNEKSNSQHFEAVESNNNFVFGKIKTLDEKKITKYPKVKGKLYKLELENKGVIYITALADEVRTYKLMVGLLPEMNSNDNIKKEFDKIAHKFIDSFEIIQSNN